MIYRREEEILAFLVLGKMLCGGHHAAGSHILMTMLVGSLCQFLNDFGWHIPEALLLWVMGWPWRGFGVLQFVHNSVYHESECGENGRSTFAMVQLEVPQTSNKSSKPWVRVWRGPCERNPWH